MKRSRVTAAWAVKPIEKTAPASAKKAIKKPEPACTPAWVNAVDCGVSKDAVEKVFAYMKKKGYTATHGIWGCSCMDAAIEICCTEDMVGREPVCAWCTHRCAHCDEPNIEFYKSQAGKPVCYKCAGYWYGDKKAYWKDSEWIAYEKKQAKH